MSNVTNAHNYVDPNNSNYYVSYNRNDDAGDQDRTFATIATTARFRHSASNDASPIDDNDMMYDLDDDDFIVNDDAQCCDVDELEKECPSELQCCIVLAKKAKQARFGVLPWAVTIIAALVYSVGSFLLLPYLYITLNGEGGSLWANWKLWTHEALCLANVVLLMVSYVRAVYTSPGYVQRDWHMHMSSMELQELLQLEPSSSGQYRYCRICGTYKPPRAHHSHAHKRCVMKMDHYCTWINNVVGAFNHKYFYLFLFYGSAGVAQLYFVAFQMLRAYFTYPERGYHPLPLVVALVAAISMLPVFIMLLAFTGFQTFLIVTNQTSIEFHTNRDRRSLIKRAKDASLHKAQLKHIYSINVLDNVRSFLGNNPLMWLLPFGSFDGNDGIDPKTIPLSDVMKQQTILQRLGATRDSNLQEDPFLTTTSQSEINV